MTAGKLLARVLFGMQVCVCVDRFGISGGDLAKKHEKKTGFVGADLCQRKKRHEQGLNESSIGHTNQSIKLSQWTTHTTSVIFTIYSRVPLGLLYVC